MSSKTLFKTVIAAVFLLWQIGGYAASNLGKHTAVSFKGIEGDMLSNVQANVNLVRELETADKLSSGQWRRLRRGALEEIKQALQPFGYYQPKIKVNDLTTELIYNIELGPPVRIRTVDIELNGPASEMPEYKKWRKKIALKPDTVLVQGDYEEAKKALQGLNLRFGYFDATLTEHRILIDEAKLNADITLKMDSRERYKFGAITRDWQGSKRQLREQVLSPYVKVTTDTPYDADALASTQASLQTTPYFSGVEVRPDLDLLENGKVPVEILLTPQKPHAFNFAIGAGTDTGLRGSVGYENRLLNSRGHNLSFRIGTSDIRRTAILNYRIPLATAVRDSINLLASIEEEDNDFRQFKIQKLGAELAKEWRDSTLSFGLLASREEFFIGDVEQTTDLVTPSIGWQKVVSDDPYFPRRGWSADIEVRGASAALGSDISLIQLLFDGKAVLPLFSGRVLARVQAAGTEIDDGVALPASLGFLTGGDNTVRGYKYESIGVPLTSDNTPGFSSRDTQDGLTVGRNLLVGSIEYEHPLRNQFAVAAFLDVGDAFDDDLDLKRGAGLGLRWRLPFGALRVDLASALDREGDPLRLHLSFGTTL